MKTIEQIAAEHEILDIGDIFTLEEFMHLHELGFITSYDGRGYFHNGENETDISVWDETITLEEAKKYPYICWYNK